MTPFAFNGHTYFYSRRNEDNAAYFTVSKNADGSDATHEFKISIPGFLQIKFGDDVTAQSEGYLSLVGIQNAELVWNPPPPEVTPESLTTEEHIEVIKTTLIAINVPPDVAETITDHLAAIVGG